MKKINYSASEQDKDPDFYNRTSSSGMFIDDV